MNEIEKLKIIGYTEEQAQEICRLEKEYRETCEEIAEQCAQEGKPDHGLDYELRCGQEREYYDQQIAMIDEENETREKNAVTRAWKVYGAHGHRQRESFCNSYKYNFSEGEETRFIEVLNSDRTGTNEYSIIRCTRNTAYECEREFYGQLDDGVFENSRVGSWEEI